MKWVPFVKLAFSLGNRAHFGSKMGLFSAFSHYVFNACGPNRGFHSFPHFYTVKIVIFPSQFWPPVKKSESWPKCFVLYYLDTNIVGKKGLFELKKCTVSGFKRQFGKWHLFRAPTPPPPAHTPSQPLSAPPPPPVLGTPKPPSISK